MLETITYRRIELYEEVWKDPVRTVAERYGVSDVALRNICRKLRVPLPGRGHWARTRVGRESPRPQLPPLTDGAPREILGRKWARPSAPVPKPAGPAILVPSELRNPHKLVSEASRLLRGRDSRDGLVRCWGTRCLDITVAPPSLARALRIMNALICELEKKGLQVEVTRPLSHEQERDRAESEAPSNATRVKVSGEWIQFGMTEKRSVSRLRTPDPPKRLRGAELESWIRWNPPRRELVPNGVLQLSIKNNSYMGVRTLWHDGKHKRLEDQLSDFVAHLQVMADAIKRHRAEGELARRQSQEEVRRRLEQEQRRAEEAERARQLEEVLARWRLARDIREYVAEVRVTLAADGAARDSELEESLAWAETFARRIDPVARVRVPGAISSRIEAEPQEPIQNGSAEAPA